VRAAASKNGRSYAGADSSALGRVRSVRRDRFDPFDVILRSPGTGGGGDARHRSDKTGSA
jgi:hypothetical protein